MSLAIKISPPNFLLDFGQFEDWVDGASAAPTGFILTGDGSVAQESTIIKEGTYSVKLTFGTTGDTYIYRDINTEFDRMLPPQMWKGRKFKLGAWVYATTANQARLQINDGVGTSSSPYHSGGGSWEWLEIERDCDESATKIQARCVVAVAGAAYFDGAIFCEGEVLFTDLSTNNINIGRWRENHTMSIGSKETSNRPGKKVLNAKLIGKNLILAGGVYGATEEAHRTQLDLLKKVLFDGPKELYYYEDRVYKGYLSGFNHDIIRASTYTKFDLRFVLDEDPKAWFFNCFRNKQTITASPTSFSITNNGNSIISPIIRIIAGGTDVTSVTLKNLTNGHVFSYTGTITAGDTLIMDTIQETIKNNGVSDLANFSNGDFLKLLPGTNQLKYTGSDCTIEIDYFERFI